METTQGVSLYSYLHLKLAKMVCFSFYITCFFLNRIGEQEGRTGKFCQKGGKRGVVQIMYKK
jgi:hypothetical protein